MNWENMGPTQVSLDFNLFLKLDLEMKVRTSNMLDMFYH